MSKLRLTITMSLDGYVAGPNQSESQPLGASGEQLHQWLLPLAAFRETHGESGGEVNASTEIAEGFFENVGATVMGRNMFGGSPGPWGETPWKGLWGDDPPYHHPVFVLTHHSREPLELEGGTTFHFVTDGIEAALEQAKVRRQWQGRLARRRRSGCQPVSCGRPARRDGDLDRSTDPRRRGPTVRRTGRRQAEDRAAQGRRSSGGHPRPVRTGPMNTPVEESIDQLCSSLAGTVIDPFGTLNTLRLAAASTPSSTAALR